MGSQNIYQRILPEPIRQLAAASIPADNANPAWAKIGTKLTNPSRVLIVQNYTDQLVSFSWDGSADATTGVSGNINLQLEAGQSFVMDEKTNNGYTAQGTQFWAQYPHAGVAPTTQSVNICTFYGFGSGV